MTGVLNREIDRYYCWFRYCWSLTSSPAMTDSRILSANWDNLAIRSWSYRGKNIRSIRCL